MLLLVDPETLLTSVRPRAGLTLRDAAWPELRKTIAATPWGRALADSESRSSSSQDAGITHALPEGSGVVLTIDLCPSRHALDRRLFRAVLDVFSAEERPVPLGIALTGAWMTEHPADLDWLQRLESRGEIAVTWINHSFSHRYVKSAPLSRNFLLQPGTDLAREVLATEARMLERGIHPSVFFRFPGLVSDARTVRRIAEFGLVAIGSDAWLAKKQEPGPGSIVLIHGNGNEPYGVARFLELLHRERSAIRSRQFLLFDLRESIRNEELPPGR